jgi:hypothetical protein
MAESSSLKSTKPRCRRRYARRGTHRVHHEYFKAASAGTLETGEYVSRAGGTIAIGVSYRTVCKSAI